MCPFTPKCVGKKRSRIYGTLGIVDQALQQTPSSLILFRALLARNTQWTLSLCLETGLRFSFTPELIFLTFKWFQMSPWFESNDFKKERERARTEGWKESRGGEKHSFKGLGFQLSKTDLHERRTARCISAGENALLCCLHVPCLN